MRHCLTILGLAVLCACQSNAPQVMADAQPPDLRAQYQTLADRAVVYALVPAASRVRIHVFRAGTAAKLGHNHVLSAPRFEGYVALPAGQVSDARFDLNVRLADLVVDDPALRSEIGGNFAGERSADDIAGTRKNMLGERGFQADQFPLVQLHSVAVEGDWPVLLAQVEITLHGVTRTQPVMLHVERGDGQLRVEGEMTLRQSDFGMTPFSALGGLMTVQDAVAISFKLVARPAIF